MATLRERVLALVQTTPGLTDREITDRLIGTGLPQQPVNQVARGLVAVGRIIRQTRGDGKLGNFPADGSQAPPPSASLPARTAEPLSEDDVKRKVQSWLEADGWNVTVVWGKGRGVDIEARRGRARWVIEAKGSGSLNPMRVNYFVAILGELLQRMSDPAARYSIALPDMRQFRRLWEGLPSPAKSRTGISALFVAESGEVREVQ